MSVTFSPNPQRILIRSVNWLGDAVMTTPALLRLREKFPQAHIAILTPEKIAGLWENHPAIDQVISFAHGENVLTIGKKLRAAKFDLAIIFPNSPRSAIEIFLGGIPKRIGYARPWRNFFLTQTVPPRVEAVKMRKLSLSEIQGRIATEPQSAQRKNSEDCGRSDAVAKSSSHQIFEYLHLVSALGANSEPLPPELLVTPEEIENVKRKFGLDQLSQPIFGLNPGAEYGPAKRWPVEKFILTAKEIQAKTDCVWILFGGKGDVEMGARFESETKDQQLKIKNLAGQTSLRELMALLKICCVLLTNDTGPMHIAAALEVPVVSIFGSTSPELTGPIFSKNSKILKSDAPCSPCFLRECPIDFRCMNGIEVDRVVETVLQCIR